MAAVCCANLPWGGLAIETLPPRLSGILAAPNAWSQPSRESHPRQWWQRAAAMWLAGMRYGAQKGSMGG